MINVIFSTKFCEGVKTLEHFLEHEDGNPESNIIVFPIWSGVILFSLDLTRNFSRFDWLLRLFWFLLNESKANLS